MNNFKTYHMVVGSSALKSHPEENIIEFPFQELEICSEDSPLESISAKLRMKFYGSRLVQELSMSTFQGRSFNKAKPWQTVLASTCFFAFATACIFFGK